MNKEHTEIYTRETEKLDFSTPVFSQYLERFKSITEPKEKTIAIYNFVRDNWRYNPYHLNFNDYAYKASYIIQKKDGHCLDKAIILVSLLRASGIPARLHLAKVKNHIAVERLEEKFGISELTPHGMVNVLLNDKWLKLSPAFNKELCALCNVDVLEFNGEEDSIFQEYDKAGNTFMEYLEDYGHFEDVPVDFIRNNMKENYPHLQNLVDDEGILNV